MAGASSSDYMVPLAGMPTRPAGHLPQQQQLDSQRKSSRESIPASSPSDCPASENEDEEMLIRRPSLSGEAETSFSCAPPSSTRRSGGYTRYVPSSPRIGRNFAFWAIFDSLFSVGHIFFFGYLLFGAFLGYLL